MENNTISETPLEKAFSIFILTLGILLGVGLSIYFLHILEPAYIMLESPRWMIQSVQYLSPFS